MIKNRGTKATTLATEAAKKKLNPENRDSLEDFKLKRFTQIANKVSTNRDAAQLAKSK